VLLAILTTLEQSHFEVEREHATRKNTAYIGESLYQLCGITYLDKPTKVDFLPSIGGAQYIALFLMSRKPHFESL
jgi:hypothetical protein